MKIKSLIHSTTILATLLTSLWGENTKAYDVRSTGRLEIVVVLNADKTQATYALRDKVTHEFGFLGSNVPQKPHWYDVSKLKYSRWGMDALLIGEGVVVVAIVAGTAGAGLGVGAFAGVGAAETLGLAAGFGWTVGNVLVGTSMIAGTLYGIYRGCKIVANGDVVNPKELYERIEALDSNIINDQNVTIEGGDKAITKLATHLHAALLGEKADEAYQISN